MIVIWMIYLISTCHRGIGVGVYVGVDRVDGVDDCSISSNIDIGIEIISSSICVSNIYIYILTN